PNIPTRALSRQAKRGELCHAEEVRHKGRAAPLSLRRRRGAPGRKRGLIGMPGRFTDLEVRDPHLIGPITWDCLPPREKAAVDKRAFIRSREWAPLDQRRFRIEPESYRTRYSIANFGRLRAHRVADSLAMEFTIWRPAVDVVRIVVFERGGARFVLPGGVEPA